MSEVKTPKEKEQPILKVAMHKIDEMITLYDFLGKAAGMELGSRVCKKAVELKEPIEEIQIENPVYTGKVHAYRRGFLMLYFLFIPLKK